MEIERTVNKGKKEKGAVLLHAQGGRIVKRRKSTREGKKRGKQSIWTIKRGKKEKKRSQKFVRDEKGVQLLQICSPSKERTWVRGVERRKQGTHR